MDTTLHVYDFFLSLTNDSAFEMKQKPKNPHKYEYVCVYVLCDVSAWLGLVWLRVFLLCWEDDKIIRIIFLFFIHFHYSCLKFSRAKGVKRVRRGFQCSNLYVFRICPSLIYASHTQCVGESKIWCILDGFLAFAFTVYSALFFHNYFGMCALVWGFLSSVKNISLEMTSSHDIDVEWEIVGELETCSRERVKCIIICLRFFRWAEKNFVSSFLWRNKCVREQHER